jgi:hypothetical protein
VTRNSSSCPFAASTVATESFSVAFATSTVLLRCYNLFGISEVCVRTRTIVARVYLLEVERQKRCALSGKQAVAHGVMVPPQGAFARL